MRVAWIPPHFEYGERVFSPPSFSLARRPAQKGPKVVIIDTGIILNALSRRK